MNGTTIRQSESIEIRKLDHMLIALRRFADEDRWSDTAYKSACIIFLALLLSAMMLGLIMF